MSWTKRWMEVCGLFASWSKDPRRGVGAVIVNDRQVQIAGGWNGLPRGVEDLPERYDPAVKAIWCEHAERNAIANAAAEGHATRGATIYCDYFPCDQCTRMIIQAGISRVVAPAPDFSNERYATGWRAAAVMLNEANVTVEFV